MKVSRRLILNNILLIPFVVLSLLAVFNHEPWRDQVQNYIAISDLGSLVETIRYSLSYSAEGPMMAVIYWFTRLFSTNFFAICMLWWLFMFTAMLLVANASPFRWYEKLLISLGYFLLYDYCVIAGRPYGLAVVLVIVVLALYPNRLKYPKTICCFLGILALAGFWGIAFSFFLSALLAYDFYKNKKSLLPLVIAICLLCVGVFFIAPRTGNVKGTEIPHIAVHLEPAFIVVKGALKTVLLTVPNTRTIWFPHTYVEHPRQSLTLALVCLVLILSVAPRRTLPGIFFWVASGSIMALFVITNHAAIRYVGMLYIVLLAGAWLDRLYKDQPVLFSIPLLHNARVKQAAFLVILLFQAWSGVNAAIIDYNHPFSGSKAAGEYLDGVLKGKDPNKVLIATYCSSYAQTLIPHLHTGHYYFYSIEMKRPYRYTPAGHEWHTVDPNSRKYTSEEIIQRFVAEINTGKYTDIFLIMPCPVNIRFNTKTYMRLVYDACRTDMMTADERFFIYKLVTVPK